MQQRIRPKGILFTTILYFVIVAVLVIAGIFIQQLWALLTTGPLSTLPIGINHDLGYNITKYLGGIYGTDGTGFVVLFSISAVIVVIDAAGLLQLKSWARLLAMLIALPLILVILGIVIIWYLMKPNVRQTFGVHKSATQQQLHDKDSERYEAVKVLVEKRGEIPLKDLAGVLEISPNDMTRHILEWSKEFSIKIKGASVLVAPSDVSKFLEHLKQDMRDWTR